MPDEEKDEAQDTRSVLEAAYDEALEPEPDEEVKAEAKPEEPAEKPAEEVTAEATPTPGDPLPEEEAKEPKPEAGTAGSSPPLGGRASGDVPGPGPQGSVVPHGPRQQYGNGSQQALSGNRAASQRRRQVESLPVPDAGRSSPDIRQADAARIRSPHRHERAEDSNAAESGAGLSSGHGQNGNGEPPSAEEDPFEIQAKIQAALNPVMQQVQQLNGSVQQQQGHSQQAGVAAGQKNIDEFRDRKGADGKPAHPYFPEVFDDMLAMAQAKVAAGQPPDIAELYESAIWSNASVRAKVQAAERHTSRQAEQQRQTRAKTAAGSLAGGGGSQTEQPKGIRESVEAAWDAAS